MSASSFLYISKHYQKPLQVMLDSEDEKGKMLLKSGFKLKRKCFERHFKKIDLIEKDFEVLQIDCISDKDKFYQEIALMAYQDYQKKHEQISGLTVDLNQFKALLPQNILLYQKDQKIHAYVFIEEQELCYFGGKDIRLKDCIYTVLNRVFETYDEVLFEADDIDLDVMAVKACFKDNDQSSFNTYIFDPKEIMHYQWIDYHPINHKHIDNWIDESKYPNAIYINRYALFNETLGSFDAYLKKEPLAMANLKSMIKVIKEEKEIVGAMVLHYYQIEATYAVGINPIVIHPLYQQKRYAFKIIEELIQLSDWIIGGHVDIFDVTIDDKNVHSIKLFMQLGFKKTVCKDGFCDYQYRKDILDKRN